MNVYWVAFVWVGMALAASLISIRIGVSVALVEIVVGAIVGNLPHASSFLHQTQFTVFLASIGSMVLTFLAGAEVDPPPCAGTGRRASASEWHRSRCRCWSPCRFWGSFSAGLALRR